MTYEEAVGYILEIPRFTKKNELNHTREFLKRLGYPQQAFLVVHVAGSNGKGSVCAYINSVLVEAGIHTGLFISPHLIDIRERFQLDKSPCSEEQFLAAEQQVRDTVNEMQQEGIPHPTFFEYIFAIAMLIFQKAGVTCAVVETGLGGRLDATNIMKPLLSVITSISLEHQEILGDTIAKIAAEKAGIIKSGVPVVYDGSNEEAGFVIRKTAKARNAPAFGVFPQNINILLNTGKKIDFCLDTGYDITDVQIPFGAPYQAQNAGVALTAVKELKKLLPIAAKGAVIRPLIDEQTVLRGFASVAWPGRMEEILADVYLDGAHNLSGIQAFMDAVEKMCDQPAILLFSMVKEKDYPNALALLCERADCWEEIILTTIPNTERSVAADTLAAICQARAAKQVKVLSIDELNEAFWQGISNKKPGQKMFCAGSLYLAGAIKKMAGGHAND